jgi:Amt family ammonium transporter
VGASCVHGIGGIWGVVAVGLFAEDPIPLGTTSGKIGLFKGGGWYLLGIQSFTALVLALWGFFGTCVLLWLVDKLTPLRMDPIDEILGTDLTEHKIHHRRVFYLFLLWSFTK